MKSHQRGSESQVGKLNFSIQRFSWPEWNLALLDFFFHTLIFVDTAECEWTKVCASYQNRALEVSGPLDCSTG